MSESHPKALAFPIIRIDLRQLCKIRAPPPGHQRRRCLPVDDLRQQSRAGAWAGFKRGVSKAWSGEGRAAAAFPRNRRSSAESLAETQLPRQAGWVQPRQDLSLEGIRLCHEAGWLLGGSIWPRLSTGRAPNRLSLPRVRWARPCPPSVSPGRITARIIAMQRDRLPRLAAAPHATARPPVREVECGAGRAVRLVAANHGGFGPQRTLDGGSANKIRPPPSRSPGQRQAAYSSRQRIASAQRPQLH
jgi:hypothetical protein